MEEDDRRLLQVVRDVQFQDATTIQIIVNQHLAAVTGAATVFQAYAHDAAAAGGLAVDVLNRAALPSRVRVWSGLCDQPDGWTRHPRVLEQLEGLLGRPVEGCVLVGVLRPDERPPHRLVVALADGPDGLPLDPSHLQRVRRCFRAVAGLLMTSLELERERQLRLQNESLLAVARNLFSHLDDVEVLLKEIMSEARQLTGAERCSLFLLDKERKCLVAKVFDGTAMAATRQRGHNNAKEVRIPTDQGIAGHVALTGQLLNIQDAYAHPLFYADVDRSTGFQTRNILCIPILNGGEVLGIAELCNKTGGRAFSAADEELATSFAIYCGISLVHSLMYKKVSDAQHRSYLSNELMMYHMKVPHEETRKLSLEEIGDVHKFDGRFCDFDFVPRTMSEAETPAAVLSVFKEMAFFDRWSINPETLTRFVLMVRKCYRDPPYHNWMHAFSVFHFCYVLIKRLQLVQNGCLTELESLALLVASLCHDVDHRGTTNSFQLASNSVLAALYSSEGSVMERHHFAQTMCILNTEGCNIFEHLSSQDYTRCLDLLQEIILATDVAHHLSIFQKLRDLAAQGYDARLAEHHQLLLYLLMTASDLSDQTKDWPSSRSAASLVYREFFKQGDLEKAMGNRPVEMMDREKACIPSLQIQFIDDVALPVYTLLSELFPGSTPLVEAVSSNRQHWLALHEANIVSPSEILKNAID